MNEPNWQREIVELHEVFEAYFLGEHADVTRIEAALDADFTFVGPDANSTDRAGTLAAIVAGHNHTDSLEIRTLDHTLVLESGDVVCAEYVEEHHLADRINRRLTTAIFSTSPDAPNGLVWRRVHETWIDQGLN